jgi:antitoxin (DNA-binding transcriptional repressor) of toxin-antitoxin stability system
MRKIDIFEARTQLSQLVQSVEEVAEIQRLSRGFWRTKPTPGVKNC